MPAALITYISFFFSNRAQIIENLRHIPCAPSVQMQEVPRDYSSSDDEDDEMDVDTRITRKERRAIIYFYVYKW
jgi:hypothetical protein